MGWDPRITPVQNFPYRRTVVPRVGDYFGTADAASNGSVVMAEGVVSMAPIVLPVQMTIDLLGVVINSAGSTGALVRVGLVSADANGMPSTLLYDGGTMDGTVTFAEPKAITPQVLPAGLYWFAAVPQGAATTRATIRVTNHSFTVPSTASTAQQGSTVVPQVSGVTGAFPTGAGAMAPTVFSGGANNLAPMARLHRSA